MNDLAQQIDDRGTLSYEGSPQPTSQSVYYQEVGRLPVNTRDREVSLAADVVRLDVALWSQLLSYPPLLASILDLAESRTGHRPADGARLIELARRARKHRTSVARGQLAELSDRVAAQIREHDRDLELASLVLQRLQQLAAGELDRIHTRAVRVGPARRAFDEYLQSAMALRTAATRARNRFVEANLRLVMTIAKKYDDGQMSYEELVQEGNIGLIKAVGRFDPDRGFRFSTYGAWWIRHAITRAISDKGRMVRVPVHMVATSRKVHRATSELSSQLGRQPTREEIARQTDLDREEVDQVLSINIGQPYSLERPISEGSRTCFIDRLEDDDSLVGVQRIEDRQMIEQVRQLLGELSPMELDILRRRFGLEGAEERTLEEIGHDYALSRERIRQLQEKALVKLRIKLERRKAA
jgi:RNA polymerase primary sigma factor